MPPKPIVISGIQPSGDIHIGNYLGALKNWVDLQNSGKYDCFFFVADLHSLSETYDAKHKREQIARTVIDLLALGIDPKKSTLFVQSHIPAHTELAWYFNCITPIAELERMTQYKDKAARQASNINVALFTYPILQAADVLLYNASYVPVGQDQVQHLELTRDIARWFNNRFGKTLREPKALLTKTPKVMSIAEPTKKMSKSLGDQHYIALFDEPEVILTKLKRAVTESTGTVPIRYERGAWVLDENALGKLDENTQRGVRGVKNLLDLLHHFAPADVNKKFAQGPIRYNDLKVELASAIGTYFTHYRAMRKTLLKDRTHIAEVLGKSAARVSEIANTMLAKIRHKVGVR